MKRFSFWRKKSLIEYIQIQEEIIASLHKALHHSENAEKILEHIIKLKETECAIYKMERKNDIG